MTERERRERNYKRTILNLATAHTKAGEIEKEQRYVMPEDRKKGETNEFLDCYSAAHKKRTGIT